MTMRWKVLLIVGLVLAVFAAGIYFPMLRKRVKRAAKLQQQSEEQARRELAQSIATNPSDPRVKARLFWASDTDDSLLVPATVELPLSSDPVLRAKQVLNTLLAGPVEAELRTLPPDAVLLAFYLLPNGTGVADFSEALGTSIPSGIASEQLAVDSITRTLEANVPQVQRLRILIHGQEVETLAGHLDLTGAFVVSTKPSQPTPKPIPAGAGTDKSAAPANDNTPASAALTPDRSTGKLAQPERKP
jgi:spore germination protein GerM